MISCFMTFIFDTNGASHVYWLLFVMPLQDKEILFQFLRSFFQVNKTESQELDNLPTWQGVSER